MAVTPLSVLAACDNAEKASVLAALIEHDPSLRQQAEEVARRHLATVDVRAVTDTVTDALLQLGTEARPPEAGAWLIWVVLQPPAGATI